MFCLFAAGFRVVVVLVLCGGLAENEVNIKYFPVIWMGNSCLLRLILMMVSQLLLLTVQVVFISHNIKMTCYLHS